VYSNGRQYPVKGYYDENRNPVIPFAQVDLKKFPNAFPDGAVWPAELQEPESFSQQGAIQNWDTSPEYLDGDFFDLKDFALGADDVNAFSPTSALKTLVACYKYWISYADVDGFRLDTVKHMGHGPTRYFTGAIHEFATRIGKENFLVVGEITGVGVYETVEATGLDAALGIGGMQQLLWNLPRGEINPLDYFNLFRNAEYLRKGSHSWLRNKVVTMVDDHDQVWRGSQKGRFCSESPGSEMMFAALALNLCTLGIPCVYYGSEQRFDGQGGDDGNGHAGDQYIREAMFGGDFGAFRSHDRHCFDETTEVYKELSAVAKIRLNELTLRRGRQYLREISGNSTGFGFPQIEGAGRMTTIVAWSRVFDNEEILCAISTDPVNPQTVFVTVDAGIQASSTVLRAMYPPGAADIPVSKLQDRLVVRLSVPPAGFVIYK
jgi:glycosidase